MVARAAARPIIGPVRRLGRISAGALAALLLVSAGPARGQALLDFVSFDGIDYLRWQEEPGRPLEPSDLGPEFAVVGCSVGEDRRDCHFGLDAAAAFMPAGTRVYAVRGHSTDFRLAAVWRDRIFLYQAWRNPRARVGGDLLGLAGKVRAIDVQRGEPMPGAPRAAEAVRSPLDADALVAMILKAPVRPPRPHAFGEPRYWLTFWLTDGTTFGRPYFADTRELMGGVELPPEFGKILERYLER